MIKPAVLFACLTALSAGGCSILPGTGPSASDVVAQGSTGAEVRFDVIEVDNRVVSSLLAQPKESLRARFEKDGSPPELRIAVGDTISVTIWESAAGGLFSEAPVQPFTGSRPATEPLGPESRPTAPGIGVPAAETPGGPKLPCDQVFGAPGTPPGPL